MARHSTRTVRTTPLLGGVLVGSALAASALLPGAGTAHAATAFPAMAPVAGPAACEALENAQAALKQAKTALENAKITWNKKLSALHTAEAKLAADPDNDALKLARDRAQAATGPAQSAYFLADNQYRSAQSTYNDAVRLADKAQCGGTDENQPTPTPKPTKPPKPSPVKHPIHGGNGDGPGQYPGPQHPPHGPHGPGLVPVGSVSNSQATAVAIATPGSAPSVTIQDTGSSGSSGSGWGDLTGWVGDWFSSEDTATGAAGESADVVAETQQAPDGVVDGSLVPAGSVATGDGADGLDAGHIGMAVAGLGALGLTSAGTAALVGRRHRQRS